MPRPIRYLPFFVGSRVADEQNHVNEHFNRHFPVVSRSWWNWIAPQCPVERVARLAHGRTGREAPLSRPAGSLSLSFPRESCIPTPARAQRRMAAYVDWSAPALRQKFAVPRRLHACVRALFCNERAWPRKSRTTSDKLSTFEMCSPMLRRTHRWADEDRTSTRARTISVMRERRIARYARMLYM